MFANALGTKANNTVYFQNAQKTLKEKKLSKMLRVADWILNLWVSYFSSCLMFLYLKLFFKRPSIANKEKNINTGKSQQHLIEDALKYYFIASTLSLDQVTGKQIKKNIWNNHFQILDNSQLKNQQLNGIKQNLESNSNI